MSHITDTVFHRCVSAAARAHTNPTPDRSAESDEAHVHDARRSRCCLARIANDGGWCIRPEHGDDGLGHIGYPSREPAVTNQFGPEDAARRRWR